MIKTIKKRNNEKKGLNWEKNLNRFQIWVAFKNLHLKTRYGNTLSLLPQDLRRTGRDVPLKKS